MLKDLQNFAFKELIKVKSCYDTNLVRGNQYWLSQAFYVHCLV